MHRFVGLVRFRGDAQRYGLRLLLAMALALALMTIAFRWPEAPADRAVSVLIDRPGREVIALDEIVQTRQEQQPPPPPPVTRSQMKDGSQKPPPPPPPPRGSAGERVVEEKDEEGEEEEAVDEEDKTDERFILYIYLKTASQEKYGSLLNNLNS